MSRSVGSGLAKIYVSDRQIDDWNADSHGQMHRSGIVCQKKAAFCEQPHQLFERSFAGGVQYRALATCFPIGSYDLCNRVLLGGCSDQHDAAVPLSTHMSQGTAEVFWTPGFHNIAGPGLYGDPFSGIAGGRR